MNVEQARNALPVGFHGAFDDAVYREVNRVADLYRHRAVPASEASRKAEHEVFDMSFDRFMDIADPETTKAVIQIVHPKTIEEWADALSCALDCAIDPEEDAEERAMVTAYWRFRSEMLGQSRLPFDEEESE